MDGPNWLRGVGQVELGMGLALLDTAKGMASFVDGMNGGMYRDAIWDLMNGRPPLQQTTQAILNLPTTLWNLPSAIAKPFLDGNLVGQGRVSGHTLIITASFVAPFAGTAKLASAGNLASSGSVIDAAEAANAASISGRVFGTLEEFTSGSGLAFQSQAEAAKAFEMYQLAANAPKGIVIGHGMAPIGEAYNGWQAFRMLGVAPTPGAVTWTESINMAWVMGAGHAGKPVLLATPFIAIRFQSVTWFELSQALASGAKVVFLR